MRICLIVEGCYPYVAGGVSSWIQMLIKGMPDHEFVIFSIGAEEKDRGKYKYDIPENVKQIHEHFLDEFQKIKGNKDAKYKLTQYEKQQFINLLSGYKVDWNCVFDMFKKYDNFNAVDFLSSIEFLEIIKDICEEKYEETPFTETFWVIRSMLTPIIGILNSKVPEADIYHCVSTGYAGIIGAKFKHHTKKPLIVTEHGIYTREREEEILKADWVDTYFKETWINFFKSLSIGGYEAGNIVTSLFSMAKMTQIELGADKSKCVTIPNGVNLQRFKDIAEIELNRDEFVLGAIVRVVPIKDIQTLIYSFDIVKKRISNAKLYIIGPYDENPEYYQQCLDTVNQLGCEGIEFVGRVDIKEWMYKLDTVILTSVSEGQPFVLLEAMSAKRPVVATDVGSCREIIEGFGDDFGHCGFVVPVMNPNLIARSVVKLAEDRNLMRAMGDIGYKRAVKYYREDDFLDRYRRLYRSVSE